MADVWRFFAHEDDYPDLDEAWLAGRLARALAIPTVDGPTPAETDWSAFDAEERLFRELFPHVFAAAEVEHVDHSLMLTLPGTDEGLRPMMLMGHMDVVPVVPGTEDDWTYGAFSGHVDDEYIWGRGAIDMTDQVAGQLEAAEYVLAHGGRLRRTLMFCLGQDEETVQSGARAMGRLLKERGIRLEFLVDEGDYYIRDMADFGAPGHHAMSVNLAEKGYADVRLTVRSAGGHSSNPFGGTSLGILSEAIARVTRMHWPVKLIELDRQTLAALGDAVTEEPLASLVAGGRASIDAHADEIAKIFHRDRDLFPLVTTTVAPTMIEGGSSQANVMPQNMTATINFRMIPGVTCSDVEEAVLEAVSGLPVEVELVSDVCNDPSAISRSDGYGFKTLERVAARYFTEEDGTPVTLVPAIVTGASDARMYEGVCDSCLRFSAFVADDDEVGRGVHGTNERITRRAYAQGVRFTIALIEAACVNPD